MTVRMGPKGQVVVPKAVRDRVGFKPGDELVVEEVDGEVRVRRKLRVADVVGVLGPPTGMEDWEAEKRAERALEEARDARRW